VGKATEADGQLIVLYDPPTDDAELRTLAASRGSARIVAIVTARQVAALRRMAGGTVAPLALPEAAMRARTREDAVRDELRTVLASGQFSRELIALEPLLSEYDGAEIAAAALRLLDAERSKPRDAGGGETSQGPLTRLYLNVGSMDNIRPGDLVGAITNEAGVSKSDLGKVDVRERHSTVEVATPVANSVVSKLTGISIRGRRVLARVDEGPERRERRDGGGSAGRGGPGSRDRRPPRESRPRPKR
jgi:ATP-dependent RNA helicase DeaD